MAGRTIWKGYIQFGSINVPVKLHTAVRQDLIQFHLLHKNDGIKLHQQMVCAYEKVPVPPEAQVKGFEVEERKYILVNQTELEQTDPEDSRMIEVHEFVKSEQIDPIFFEHLYYLEPEVPLNGYTALLRALKEMNMAGICTWTMRKRSYFGALHPNDKILCLSTMRHADEVVSVNSLDIRKVPVSEKELKIGISLINQLTAPFQPQNYENEHERKLQNLIDKKAKGEHVALLKPRRLKPTASDQLLQTLEASLKKVA